jgi:hypothetical protein
MDIEEHYGNKIVCRHIFDKDSIQIGSRWQSSCGTIVTVESICDLGWITYSWVVDGIKKTNEKESFAFQCRYCLILENPNGLL